VQLHAEEPVKDGAAEALDEAVGFRRADLGSARLDAGETEIENVGVVPGAAEFAAIFG
jgi:hypothetical protein